MILALERGLWFRGISRELGLIIAQAVAWTEACRFMNAQWAPCILILRGIYFRNLTLPRQKPLESFDPNSPQRCLLHGAYKTLHHARDPSSRTHTHTQTHLIDSLNPPHHSYNARPSLHLRLRLPLPRHHPPNYHDTHTRHRHPTSIPHHLLFLQRWF